MALKKAELDFEEQVKDLSKGIRTIENNIMFEDFARNPKYLQIAFAVVILTGFPTLLAILKVSRCIPICSAISCWYNVEERKNKNGELISYRLICSGKDTYSGKHKKIFEEGDYNAQMLLCTFVISV